MRMPAAYQMASVLLLDLMVTLTEISIIRYQEPQAQVATHSAAKSNSIAHDALKSETGEGDAYLHPFGLLPFWPQPSQTGGRKRSPPRNYQSGLLHIPRSKCLIMAAVDGIIIVDSSG